MPGTCQRLSGKDGTLPHLFPYHTVAGPAEDLPKCRDKKGELSNMSDKYQLSATVVLMSWVVEDSLRMARS